MVLLLAGTHVDGARPLLPLLDLKLDVVPFAQTIEIKVLQAGAVKKHLLTLGASDETKPPVPDEPFDSALHVEPRFPRKEAFWTGSQETRLSETSHSSATLEL
jgi:hypothetical protein